MLTHPLKTESERKSMSSVQRKASTRRTIEHWFFYINTHSWSGGQVTTVPEHNLPKVSWVIESGKRKKTESAMPVLTDSDVYYGLVRISSLNSQFKVSASGWVGICVCAHATKMNSQQNLNIKRLRVKALFESDFRQIYNPNSRNVGTFLKTWIKLKLKDFRITLANIVFTIEHREHNKCLNGDIFYSNSKNVPTFLEFGLYICNFFYLQVIILLR